MKKSIMPQLLLAVKFKLSILLFFRIFRTAIIEYKSTHIAPDEQYLSILSEKIDFC